MTQTTERRLSQLSVDLDAEIRAYNEWDDMRTEAIEGNQTEYDPKFCRMRMIQAVKSINLIGREITKLTDDVE